MTLRIVQPTDADSTPPVADVAAELLDLDQAAAKLRIGRTKLYALIAAGQIRSVKLGRKRHIRESEINRYILASERAGLAPRRHGGVR
jgi:excisionase family DNA binding protein